MDRSRIRSEEGPEVAVGYIFQYDARFIVLDEAEGTNKTSMSFRQSSIYLPFAIQIFARPGFLINGGMRMWKLLDSVTRREKLDSGTDAETKCILEVTSACLETKACAI